MARLRGSPELSAMVQSYVEAGGALFAFLSEPGDYGDIIGAPLRIKSPSGPPDRFEEPWRVVAFREQRQGSRIIERGEREAGGYVLLWLDDPGSFRGRRRETAVQEVRAKVEERVLKWARYLMLRRYDKTAKQRRQAELDLP